MPADNNKQEIRTRVLALRNGLSAEERKRSEILITERILGHQWYYLAKTILLYKSAGSELSTDLLLAESVKSGKAVYLPKVTDPTGALMTFYRYEGEHSLCRGYGGILEPTGEDIFSYEKQSAETALMLMPGVAFDLCKNRLGYGRGFYDRYLADKPLLPTIAIGYACQMVDRIPSEDSDVQPMQVICL